MDFWGKSHVWVLLAGIQVGTEGVAVRVRRVGGKGWRGRGNLLVFCFCLVELFADFLELQLV